MKYAEAQLLKQECSNLTGHLVKDKTIVISKLFIAPTNKKEYDKFMKRFILNLHTPVDFENTMKDSDIDVEIYVLYYEDGNKPSIMILSEFKNSIPHSDLKSNIQ